MKTIEEKAKAYNEALERARAMHDVNYTDSYTKANLETIFPELRESEDEKIRKAIFKALSKKDARDVLLAEGVQVSEALAYLEKQEQKPDDVKREWWNKGYLEGRKNAHIPARELGLPSSWDFQKEQKPAPDWMPKFLDELRSKKNYFDWDEHRDIEGHILAIINWIDPNYFDGKEKEQKPIEFKNDELVEIIKGEFEGFRQLLKKKGIDYEPQRGYWEGFARLFDSSAREYVKEQKEQKPAEKQDYSGLNDFERALHRGFLCAGVVNVPVAIIKETAQECMAKIKPVEWSVEDETQRINTIIFLQTPTLRKVYQQSQVDKAVKWLRNLRPQPKQEWSEEDKQWLESIIREYEERLSVDKDHAAVIQVKIDLLKSLRPSWKPSEEQMRALGDYIDGEEISEYDMEEIVRLYHDLKKL